MKAWQFGMILAVIGVGGAAVFFLSRREPKGGHPSPTVSIHRAATTGTGSSGDETNKYDAVIGIGAALGSVVSSAIESGALGKLFDDDEDDNVAVRSSDDAGIAAPGQTLIFN